MERSYSFTKSWTRIQHDLGTIHIADKYVIAFEKKLKRGVYQYKYIVDGDWRFSPDDATTHDEQGNINNVIDTTQIEPAIQEISRQGSTLVPEKKYQKVEINTQAQFHETAPPVPAHLLQVTFLNVNYDFEYGHTMFSRRKKI